jgi:hypothetical protein
LGVIRADVRISQPSLIRSHAPTIARNASSTAADANAHREGQNFGRGLVTAHPRLLLEVFPQQLLELEVEPLGRFLD